MSTQGLENIKLDTGNRFQQFALSSEETNMALKFVPALFIAYLTNKVAAYASALVDHVPEYHADPNQQVQAILKQERLRNFVSAYEELLAEILDASSTQPTDE